MNRYHYVVHVGGTIEAQNAQDALEQVKARINTKDLDIEIKDVGYNVNLEEEHIGY